jgi:hypothetical protein
MIPKLSHPIAAVFVASAGIAPIARRRGWHNQRRRAGRRVVWRPAGTVDLKRSQARSYFDPLSRSAINAVLMLPDTFGFLDKVLIQACNSVERILSQATHSQVKNRKLLATVRAVYCADRSVPPVTLCGLVIGSLYPINDHHKRTLSSQKKSSNSHWDVRLRSCRSMSASRHIISFGNLFSV